MKGAHKNNNDNTMVVFMGLIKQHHTMDTARVK
jgi:hypothetical protein